MMLRLWLLAHVAVTGLALAQDLIRIDAGVADGERLLGGLKAEDFRVTDGRRELPLVRFEEGRGPLDLLLLVDASGKLSGPIRKIGVAAGRAMDALEPGDRVAVMVFSQSSHLVLPFTEDMRLPRETLLNLDRGKNTGPIRILTGAAEAARVFLSQPSGRRRAVLLITDNEGSGLDSEVPVVRAYWEASASLHALVIPPRWVHWQAAGPDTPGGTVNEPAQRSTSAQEPIDGVVEQTGGTLLRTKAAPEAFRLLVGVIRKRYSLYVRPPAETRSGDARPIKVDLSPEARERLPKAHVLAPHGYLLSREAGS